ncbi:hypothetical protein BCR42DRAFT_412645 [Absidia repens]|uniref:ATPase inhibitor, mitochondrial n=1 Tax=Absidia repens TaxID=90262 RepID=A0A1X2IJY1_9FUNG|nr:hypothetical protein BCR42DRAFT_412645 [Absidia repens]
MFSRSAARLRTNVIRSTKRFSSSESSGSAGSTVTSKGGFSDKERAAETQWARAHDAEKLKLLREELSKHKKATEDLEQKVNELSKK